MENSNKPAFATPPFKRDDLTDSQSVHDFCQGLTKREYFAAKAMQGYLSSGTDKQRDVYRKDIAHWSIEIADELLKQLSAPQPPIKKEV